MLITCSKATVSCGLDFVGFGCDAATEGQAVTTYETFDQSVRDNALDVSPNSDDYASIVETAVGTTVLEITNFRPSHYLTVYQSEALRVQGGFRVEFTFRFEDPRGRSDDDRAEGFTFLVSKVSSLITRSRFSYEMSNMLLGILPS